MNIEQILEMYKRRIKKLKQFIRSSPEDQQIIHTSNKTLLRVGKNPDQRNVDEFGRKVFIRQALRGQKLVDPNAMPDTSVEGMRKGYLRFTERENAMHMVTDPLKDRKDTLAKLLNKLPKKD